MVYLWFITVHNAVTDIILSSGLFCHHKVPGKNWCSYFNIIAVVIQKSI